MEKTIKFEALIKNDTIEKLNDDFSKAECYVMYVDANRNGSFITKDAVEDAMSTIYNIPVVAEVLYKEDEKDFGTHGGRLIMDSNGIRFEQTTVPYGVVPESCNPRWEFVGDKEYLVCDVILWTGRYDDMQILLEDEEQSRPQSMEIHVLDSFVDDDGYEQIEKLSFSALTILGANVEPCFEDARVKLYEQYTQDGFQSIFEDMRNAYSKFCKEGGNDSVDNVDNKEKFEKDVDDVNIDNSSEPVVKTGEEFVENDVEDKNEPVEENFELSYRDKMKLLYEALPKSIEEEVDGVYKWQDTYIMDFTDSKVDYEVYGNMGERFSNMYRASYTMEGETATVDFEGQEELFRELITKSEKEKVESERDMLVASLNDKIDELNGKVEEFGKENEKLKAELETEKEFRLNVEEQERKEAIDSTIADFENVLGSEEEFEAIKENAYDMTCEQIEEKCYVLIGKMNFKKNTKPQKKERAFSVLNINDKKEKEEANVIEEIGKAYSKEM